MLLQQVRVDPTDETPVDVRIAGDVVDEISTPGERLQPRASEDVVDCGAGVLLPGFVDGHVHMAQWAMARRRLDVGAATGAADLVDMLVASGTTEDVRAQGFRGALWTDTPHKDMLESALPGVSVAVTSMDLHTVWLSPALMSELGVEHPTGVFRDHEAIAMLGVVDAGVGQATMDAFISDGTDDLAARGVTEVLDFEYDDNWAAWSRRMSARPSAVRVSASTWPHWLEESISRGRRTGDVAPDTDSALRMGPLKIMADGSLNTRTACCHDPYPDADEESHGLLLVDHGELVHLISRAAGGGIASAVHAIGDRANTVVLDAFETVRERGAPPVGGRVEHAQQVRPEDLRRFRQLGVVASVQPQHAVTDRDVADALWSGRRSLAYGYHSLHRHGATLQ
ncbi:MAG: amidohydrolase family protein, partial [Rhodococcus sp. (in: high G+C Gram-positive bacteria)]